MEKYCLQKRSVLSFKTGRYEDGDISYMYVIHTYSFENRYPCVVARVRMSPFWH